MKNFSAKLIFILTVFILINSCTDRGYTEVNSGYYIVNTSSYDINLIFFSTDLIKDTHKINKTEKIFLGNYSESIVPEFRRSDSIEVVFGNDKTLTYYLSNFCQSKSMFCPTSFICFDEINNNAICEFEIDNTEYQRAN